MREKWRPRLGLVVLAILVTVLALPLAGLFFFRFYENQLIRQTEAELISQGAALGAAYAQALQEGGVPPDALGAPAPPDEADPELGPFRPVDPSLDLAADPILPPRPDAVPAAGPSPLAGIGARMTGVLLATQRSTLTGLRLLDPQGRVIAGRSETGGSLAGVEEVRDALAGRYRSVLRQRVSDQPVPPLYSISRGTRLRVFVAMPVVTEGRIAGVVYLSRTPNNVLRHLYAERGKLVAAGLAVAGATLLIAFLFIRLVSRPMHELRRRTARIAAGDAGALAPLAHHGTREMAELSAAFLDMARKLQTRSDAIRTFATHLSHELKSPLTAIRGAAELLHDEGDQMEPGMRRRFTGNILADTDRLDRLLRRMIELTRAENADPTAEISTLAQTLAGLDRPAGVAVDLGEGADLPLSISGEALGIVLVNLLDNSARHGAGRVALSAEPAGTTAGIEIRDDGAGVSPANRERIFEPFFTTRRETGGTGLGLGIVVALLKAHGGTIRLEEAERGAAFRIDLPRA